MPKSYWQFYKLRSRLPLLKCRELPQFFCRKVHKPGVVAFAAVRHGGHVGAVRFQHDAVERQLLNNFNGFFAFLKVTAPPKLNFSPKSRHSNAVSRLPE